MFSNSPEPFRASYSELIQPALSFVFTEIPNSVDAALFHRLRQASLVISTPICDLRFNEGERLDLLRDVGLLDIDVDFVFNPTKAQHQPVVWAYAILWFAFFVDLPRLVTEQLTKVVRPRAEDHRGIHILHPHPHTFRVLQGSIEDLLAVEVGVAGFG